jgi:hypothetical protein
VSETLLLARHEINDTYWNALLDECTHPVVYAYSWYLDVVSPHWQALILPQTDGYRAVMPLPVRKKWGLLVVQQPLFCQFLGIFARETVAEPLIRSFIQQLHRHFSYISNYSFHPELTSILQKCLRDDPNLAFFHSQTHWLNLHKPYEAIARGFTPDRKANLQRAYKQGWKKAESEDIEPMIRLFRLHHAGRIRGGVAESAYTLLRRLAAQLVQRKVVRIYYAHQGGEFRAGIMAVVMHGTSTYLFNSADETGRKGNARTWLLDGHFKEMAGKIEYFDFESPEVDGIRNFYESFGVENKVFLSIKKNKLPFPIRQLQELRKWWLKAT